MSTPTPEPADTPDLRDVQVRHPWHFRLLVRVVTIAGAVVLWCWFRTLRITVINGEQEKALRTKGPILYATWHRGVLCTVCCVSAGDCANLACDFSAPGFVGAARWSANRDGVHLERVPGVKCRFRASNSAV